MKKGGKIMKLELNKFYNSNYKDFVHTEALEEALRMVAEIDLKEVEIDTILSVTFSVDEFGENPMYVEYLDKDGKKHIVRIRPAVTNEMEEMLKRYVTLEQHETDKNAIYNHFEHIHVPMEVHSQNGLDDEGNKSVTLNNDNSSISFQVDTERDNEIQWLCIHNKGGLGSQSKYFARFMDYAKIDQVPSNDEFLEKIQQLEELIQRKSQETLQDSKEYTDTQDNTLRTEITTNVTNQINEAKNGILSYVDVEVDNLKEYVDNRDAEYHELSKRYTDNAKQEAVNSSKTYTDNKTAETLETSKTYTDTKHAEVTQHVTELENDMNTNFATKQEMLTNVESLSDIDQQNFEALNDRINSKATVYKKKMNNSVRYYFPQINVTTKTDDDIILEGKDETTVKLANLLNDAQLAKLKNLPETLPDNVVTEEQLNQKTNSYLWDTIENRIIDFEDGNEVFYDIEGDKILKIGLKNKTGESQKFIRFDQFVTLENIASVIGNPQPIEINVSYNGSVLELNNYSSYTTIGNSTIVNINCNFTAPFSSGTTPILNALNISGETFKSFPLFMMDCIVKTATNVSSYTTTTTFSNQVATLYVETPVVKPNETIGTTLISFNGSYIFNNTKEGEHND